MSKQIREIPKDHYAEQGILGCLMLDKRMATADAFASITSEEFHSPVHQMVFVAMRTLFEKRVPVEPITLMNELKSTGLFEDIGGINFVMQLGEREFTTTTLPHYIKIVKDKARLRQLLEVCGQVSESAFRDDADATEVAELAESLILSLRSQDRVKSIAPVRDLLAATVQAAEDAVLSPGEIQGLPTGFVDLDRLLGGLQQGDLGYLAARPSMGKTLTANAIFINTFKTGGFPLFFSVEMSKAQLSQRILCAEAGVDGNKIRNGTLTPQERARLREAHERLKGFDGYIDDAAGITPAYIRSMCHRVASERPLDLVVVDHVGLMNSGMNRPSKNDELEYISRSLRETAKEFKVPIIALSQLSRAVERREDKHPMLSDLRDSGNLEQDADWVGLMYRKSYYERPVEGVDPLVPVEVEINIAKGRNVGTGIVKLGLVLAHQRVVPLEWRDF